MEDRLIVTASPHIRDRIHHPRPDGQCCHCAAAPVWWPLGLIFGCAALLVTAVSALACVAFEYLYCKLLKKSNPWATCPPWSPASFWL